MRMLQIPLLALTGCLAVSGAGAAEPRAIEIAVLPYFSPRTLLEQYEPLRAFISDRLHRPTFLATAKDYRTFVQRTQTRGYPFIITGPHLGRLAQMEAGYRPLAGWKANLQGLFLVRRDSPMTGLSDLRGHSIAAPPPLAVTTMLGLDALERVGLGPDQVKVVTQPSHNAAVRTVLRGENAAALVWSKTLATIEPEVRDQLRIIAKTEILPTASLFLASPDYPKADALALRDALLAFCDTAAGKDFLTKSDYEGIIAIEPEDLDYLDRFLAPTRRALTEEQE